MCIRDSRRAVGTVTEGGSSAAEYDAIQFKKQGNGVYNNVVISGYTTAGATAVRIQDTQTNTDQVIASKIRILGVKILDGTSNYAAVSVGSFTTTFDAANFVVNSSATGASLTAGAWATVDGVNLLSNL